jgi:hypothetical protein
VEEGGHSAKPGTEWMYSTCHCCSLSAVITDGLLSATTVLSTLLTPSFVKIHFIFTKSLSEVKGIVVFLGRGKCLPDSH